MEDRHPITSVDRRQAIKQLAVAFGAVTSMPYLEGQSAESLVARGTAIHQHLAQEAGTGGDSLVFLNAHQLKTVSVISELIIPQTSTPGASAAKVGQFIDLLLSSLELSYQQEFLAGLAGIDERSSELFQKVFVDTSLQQQTELLTQISSENSSTDSTGSNFFSKIKSLTAFGYYTSKEGLETELGYRGPGYPGLYQGCTDPEHHT
jgi:Gluconate 2-dehydrogenase subunit 3